MMMHDLLTISMCRSEYLISLSTSMLQQTCQIPPSKSVPMSNHYRMLHWHCEDIRTTLLMFNHNTNMLSPTRC